MAMKVRIFMFKCLKVVRTVIRHAGIHVWGYVLLKGFAYHVMNVYATVNANDN